MMTNLDSTGSSLDGAFVLTSGTIDKLPREPIQDSLPPNQSGNDCPPNSTADDQASQTPAMYVHDRIDDSTNRHSRHSVHIAIVILACSMGIGVYWSFENLGQIIGPASVTLVQTRGEEESIANQREAPMSAKKPNQNTRTPAARRDSEPNTPALAEKRLVDSVESGPQAPSHIDVISDRLSRLDDEFSRLKIDLADMKNAEVLRRHNAARSAEWTQAISTGQLLLRASPDERTKISIPLVFVPSGRFVMGQTEAQRVESARASSAAHYDFSYPAHPVHVQSGYFIGVYEITIGQLEEFAAQYALRESTSSAQRASNETDRNKPACNIDWKTAMHFCEWLSEINKIAVRLPTEVEWEYAARGNMYVQQLESLRERDVVMGGPWAVDTHTLDRTWCGCVAMNSNVQEWTIDSWDEKAYERRDAMLQNSRPSASFLYTGIECGEKNSLSEPRAVRGSSFQDIPANRVLAIRRFKPINAKEETLGFRIVVPIVNQRFTGE